MFKQGFAPTFAAVAAILMSAMASAQSESEKFDRTVLPIPEPQRPLYTELDVRNVKAPPRFEVKAPAGAPNVVIVLIDDIGFGAAEHLRRPDPDADARPAGAGGPALQQLPHHGALLADAGRAEVRPQPPHGEHGLHHGDGDRASRATPARFPNATAPAGRDAAPERLQHRRLRQVARDGRLGDERLRAVRPLADAPGLRQVLRLHRRRDQPVGAATSTTASPRSNCRTTRTTTS